MATVILPKEIQKLYSVVTTAMPVNCLNKVDMTRLKECNMLIVRNPFQVLTCN